MSVSNELKAFWNKVSSSEEVDHDDESINRALRWREIERQLPGVKTILDIGAATGAFSIPLAQQGYQVTHLDFSEAMLEKARQKAKGLSNLQFIQADASNLDMIEDQAFDLVLNFDGPISFSGELSRQVIAESCRVTKKKLMVTVSNKSCMSATWLNYSMNTLGDLSPAVEEMIVNGYWDKNQFTQNEQLSSIKTLKAYSPDELRSELTNQNMDVVTSRAIGSLPHLYLIHLYRQLSKEQVSEYLNRISQSDSFIDLCERYDQENPDGPGSFRRAGLFALALRK